jgi:two-component system, OmpR family, response regulator CpxR
VQEIEARILLIDDDAELGTLMREFFSEHGIDVTLAYSGPAGLQRALAGIYDLVLLDVMMPGFDGFEVLRRLRGTSSVPVLMLTARTESASRIRGLEGGADDYLPKPFEPLELLARIRAIMRRTRPSIADSEAPVEVSGVRMDPASRRVSFLGRALEVTTIEYDILETLMRSAGRVVSRDDLMRRLYGRESTPFDRSVDVHVSHLRKKLDAPRELIQTVRGVGYQFAVETPVR